jgi:hypothetical protein
MKSQTSNRVLLIGLPHTGKTSFLAALWYMVGQSSIDCAFELDHLDGESEYLNKIRDAWLGYKPVPRNKAESEKIASMWLRERATSGEVRLGFPDLSGESFRMQWTQRQMALSYEGYLREATGGILFVHPETINKPQQIATVQAALDAMGGPDVWQKSESETKTWDSEKAPTQVQLVDLLQFMVSRSYFRAPFPLAVVVSAWDRVPSGRRPSVWISSELPLIKQYLDSNDDLFDAAYYGLSAQGGRYALPHFWSRNFLEEARPFAERICAHTDPISAWVWAKLDPSSHPSLELIRAGSNTTESQRKGLAKDMNKLMAQPDIYDKARFVGVELRPETESLLRLGVLQKDEEKPYLSRLLLEDAYPELSREREHAKEALALGDKLPSARVLLVGDSVKMQHDITEPIQWLMR